MPSPSRIPRAVGLLHSKNSRGVKLKKATESGDTKDRSNPESCTDHLPTSKQLPREPKKYVAKTQNSLDTGLLNNDKASKNNQQKKHNAVNDRRGISEVKRSESNLRNKVESLENELCAMNNRLMRVQEKADSADKQEILLNEMQLEIDRLHERLEEHDIDPVAQEKIQISSLVSNAINISTRSGEKSVEEIVEQLNRFDELSNDIVKRLTAQPFPFT